MGLQFVDFVVERHKVWERRQAGLPAPWTTHEQLMRCKFTNVFRILDYGSQWLVKELLDPTLSEREVLFRCFLYRHTGRWQMWEYFKEQWGYYPMLEDLPMFLATSKAFRAAGNTVFTNAYLVYPQSSVPGSDKLESIFDLAARLFTPGSAQDLVPDFLKAHTQPERFKVLRRNKGVADFMSQQVLTDWGYTEQCGQDLDNMQVVCGPGAKKGAIELGLLPPAALDWAQAALDSLPVGQPQLAVASGLRVPTRMDLQNCLCEFSKLARMTSGGTYKSFVSQHPGPQPPPVLPAHW